MSAPELIIDDVPATGEAARHCLELYYRELRERFEEGFDPAKSVLHSLAEFDRRAATSWSCALVTSWSVAAG